MDEIGPVIREGLPEGWTFATVEHGDFITYEVRNDQRFLIMSSTWNRSWLGVPAASKDSTE